MGHFDEKHYRLLKAIHAAGGVQCEDFPELFYPEEIRDPMRRQLAVLLAKRMCNECPIKAECFRYAVESGQRFGIWAGTTPQER
jgi:WhiB family redox-sensing transcriptional regulator